MFWLIRRIIRDFPSYERPVQLALVAGVLLLVIAFVIFLVGSPEIRVPTLIGIIALVLVVQLSVLWGNRGMVTPVVAAQRAYLQEDFAAVLGLLEPLREARTGDMRALALLGNTYRQLGRLAESREVLLEALDKAPDHHYPLYGFGRTLLSQGEYTSAAEVLLRALNAGAPQIAWLDVAEAHYRSGDFPNAESALVKAEPALQGAVDAYRKLLAAFLRKHLTGEVSIRPEIVAEGLPYWRAAAERYVQTPYGQAVAAELDEMAALGAGQSR